MYDRIVRFAVLPSFLLLLACGTDVGLPEADHLVDEADSLAEHQTFEWVRSSGGIAYREYTPGNTGYSVRITMDGNSLRAYRDGNLIGTAQFQMRKDSIRRGPYPVYRVTFDHPLPVFTFDSFEGDMAFYPTAQLTVAFEDPCCDRYTHIFIVPYTR